MNRFLITKDHSSLFDKVLREVGKMTIGIAAICESNTPFAKIVFCADRLVSGQISFEAGNSKLKPLASNCWGMAATNYGLKSDMMLDKVKQQLSGRNPKVKEVVELLAEECKRVDREELERNVFSYNGMDYDYFNNNMGQHSRDFLNFIDQQIRTYRQNEYRFQADFLIFGIDDFSTPHLYVVNQSGEYNSYDYIGYAAIGSGAAIAYSEMTKYVYSTQINYIAALCQIYYAKILSQRGGAGQSTDLAVLHVTANPQNAEEKVYSVWLPADNFELANLLDSFIRDIATAEGKVMTDTVKKIASYLYTSEKEAPKPPSDNKKQ